MAIYTKTGDKGETKVFDKISGALVKISKSSKKIKTIGAVDELNSFIGIIRSQDKDKTFDKNLTEIQKDLFTINSILAGSKLRFSKIKTQKLEKQIDKWEGSLPVLKNFIYYGGSKGSSLIFYARALCRRAERQLVSFSHIQDTNPNILIYMNRLSDYLFMLAREINHDAGAAEEVWKAKIK